MKIWAIIIIRIQEKLSVLNLYLIYSGRFR